MNWLDRIGASFKRELKESATGPLRSAMLFNQAIYKDRLSLSKDRFAYESMRAVIPYSAVRLISKSFASVEWTIQRKGKDGVLGVVNAPDLERLLDRPSPLTSGSQFRGQWATHFAIHGEGPVEKVLNSRGLPSELYTLEPERIGVLPGATGLPAGYEWKAESGRKRRFEVNVLTGDCPLRFIKTPNPVDQWRGLAPTFPASPLIDAMNAGSEWNAALLQNAAQPSGILSTTEMLTDEQHARLTKTLNERMMGSENARRPVVLEGGLSWTSLSMTPSDLEWTEGNRENARQIALAYGVPPVLLGIPGDSTYSNLREARLALFDDTIIPLIRLFADEMNAWLVPHFGDGIELVPDIDGIEALAYRIERKVEALKSADWLSINEKRAEMGYEAIDPDMGGDLVPGVEAIWSAPAMTNPAILGNGS